VKIEKTKGLHKKPYPKVGSKNPKSWEKTHEVATLPSYGLSTFNNKQY